MATALSAQLQVIRNIAQLEPERPKRPLTRPSVLFDPKEAADIDLDTLLSIALSGFEALVSADDRFRSYKDTLFSLKSRDVDRELMGLEENKRLNSSISSYLRLLSGFFNMNSALKTLEYLIRRYKIHVYNVEEILLCALPYHDTTTFVRIVQLLQLSGKWVFLEGVKGSGASLPRKVIVQQCIKDTGILEALCNYTIASKKIKASREAVCFCTAVVVEALGAISVLDNELVKKILPFVYDGLSAAINEVDDDHKAGSLMIVGILATRAALAPKLINSLIIFVAKTAQQDASNSHNLPRLRLALMAIVNIVQSQHIQVLPKKALEYFQHEMGEFVVVLVELSKEFNIDQFMLVYLGSLIDYCSSDNSLLLSLGAIIESGLIMELVDIVVFKVLLACLKMMERTGGSNFFKPGAEFWARGVLDKINTLYPSELRVAVRKSFENPKLQSRREVVFEFLRTLFDGNPNMPLEISDSELWYSLEHPKAEVRRAAVRNLASSDIEKIKTKNHAIVDAVLRRLQDDNLGVTLKALSIDGLFKVINPSCLFKAFEDIIVRCVGHTNESAQACEVAMECLHYAVFNGRNLEMDYSNEIAGLMFPLLLISRKTWRLNLKALEWIEEIRWPFYEELKNILGNLIFFENEFDPIVATSINVKVLKALAHNLALNPQVFIDWMVDCCKKFTLSKTVFFLVMLESFMTHVGDDIFMTLFEAFFPIFKNEWSALDFQDDGNVIEEIFSRPKSQGDGSVIEDVLTLRPTSQDDGSVIVEVLTLRLKSQEDGSVIEEVLNEKLDDIFPRIMGKVLDWKSSGVNLKVLKCTFWILAKVVTTMFEDNSVDGRQKMQIFENLFVFSVSSCLKTLLVDHLHHVLMKEDCLLPVLKRFIVDEGFSSDVCLAGIQVLTRASSSFLSPVKSSTFNNQMQLLCEFPSLLVPLASDNQDIRDAALDGIESFYRLSRSLSEKEISKHAPWKAAYGELLGLIVWQRKLITTDANLLPSLLESLLGSSSSLLMPQNTKNSLDNDKKKIILDFLLDFCFNLSPNGKLKMIYLFKPIGGSIMNRNMVRLLAELLNRRKPERSVNLKGSFDKMSSDDIDTLCILLEICASVSNSDVMDRLTISCMLKALKLEQISSSEDLAMIKPCLALLTRLSSAFYDSLGAEMQDEFFQEMVILTQNVNGDIREAAKEALQRINITCTTVTRFLDRIIADKPHMASSAYYKAKRKKSDNLQNDQLHSNFLIRGSATRFLTSLLDVLLLKKDILNRVSLIEPLFGLLHRTLDCNWIVELAGESEEDHLESISGVQQMVLIVLEDISTSISSHFSKIGDLAIKFDIDLLVKCARAANNPTTCNHVFLLLTSIAKVYPDQVLSHCLGICAALGETTIMQSDSYSNRVFEDLISTVVPYWISKMRRVDELLQIFVNTLSKVAEHRRLCLFVFLLRILGEKESLGLLVVLLVRSLIQQKEKYWSDGNSLSLITHLFEVHREWEYIFALQIFERYDCTIWIPSLAIILGKYDVDNHDLDIRLEMLMVMRFILDKLKGANFVFLSSRDEEDVQMMLSMLMETVISMFHHDNSRGEEDNILAALEMAVKQCVSDILKAVAKCMCLSTYFKTMTRLLQQKKEIMSKKVLLLIYEAKEDFNVVQQKRKGKKKLDQKMDDHRLSMDMTTSKFFEEMCSEIVRLIDVSSDLSFAEMKVLAISTLEVLANKFPSNHDTFVKCLTCLCNYISSDNLSISASCLRCVGALVNIIGTKALPIVPKMMEDTLRKARDSLFLLSRKTKDNFGKAASVAFNSKEPFFLSILIMLGPVIEKLGCFLNPYLQDIIELLVLNSDSLRKHLILQQKASSVKNLVTEKIPVRLLVAPLLNMYPETILHGDWSISEFFQMLTRLINKMDRTSLNLYHMKIFDQCLLALDLRRQRPSSVKDIDTIEELVTDAFAILTMKCTEAMFNPLFLQCLEWAETVAEGDCTSSSKIDRIISFYKLINKLVDQHRSLFVPYFKYLLESCNKYLTDDQNHGLSHKRKKARKGNKDDYESGNLSIAQWHLRALILSSLYKCFLHDTGNLKPLDSTNFQILLKSIASQLTVQPPKSLKQYPSIPSVEEVDDTIVSCLGQMAVTAGTDELWQTLNHEVLMQTRDEKVRPRILGLRVVKGLIDRLKEEYVAVCLAENVRFLSELIEDAELPVKALAQQILKEMGTISGEDIKDYM